MSLYKTTHVYYFQVLLSVVLTAVRRRGLGALLLDRDDEEAFNYFVDNRLRVQYDASEQFISQ